MSNPVEEWTIVFTPSSDSTFVMVRPQASTHKLGEPYPTISLPGSAVRRVLQTWPAWDRERYPDLLEALAEGREYGIVAKTNAPDLMALKFL